MYLQSGKGPLSGVAFQNSPLEGLKAAALDVYNE